MVRFGLPHRTTGGNGVANGSGTGQGQDGRQTEVEPLPEPPSPTAVQPQPSSGFFTLPMWKRRQPARGTGHDELGQQIRQPVFDKALPPTPPASEEGHQPTTTPRLRTSPSQLSLLTSRPASVIGSDQHQHQPAAAALAQASLGVGLPHVIGRASISSAASDGDRPALDQHAPSHSIRRVHSSQRLAHKPEELSNGTR